MERPPAAEDGFHVTAAEGEPLLQLEEGEHLRVALLVLGQELLGFALAHAGFPSEALGSHAVNHTEVDGFAEPAFVRADLVFVQQQPGGQRVHVVAAAVGLLQHLFAREVGEDPQFDLGVVGAEQGPALLGQEGLADAPAVLGAHGNVLQVGVAAAQAPSGRHCLVEIGVHPPGFRLHQLRQGVDVGALELAEHPVLQHQWHHRVVVAEFLKHGGIGAEAGFGAAGFLAIQAKGVEQQLSELLG